MIRMELIIPIVTFIVTVSGIILNTFVFLASHRMVSMNSSFGIITKYQTICNTMMCCCFLSFVPFQLGALESYIPYTHFVGTTAITSDEISNLSHLLTAINRFLIVFLPSLYEKCFSIPKTKIMILVIWISSIVGCITLYEFIGCLYPYNTHTWSLQYLDTPMCDQLTWYSDFTFNISLGGITLSLNFLTAFKAGRNNRQLVNAAGLQLSKLQRQREMNFIRQTFFQGLCVFTGQVTYYVIAPHIRNTIILFIFTSLWGFMHAVEGGIIILSNKEMRSVFSKKNVKPSTVTVFVTSNSHN